MNETQALQSYKQEYTRVTLHGPDEFEALTMKHQVERQRQTTSGLPPPVEQGSFAVVSAEPNAMRTCPAASGT